MTPISQIDPNGPPIAPAPISYKSKDLPGSLGRVVGSVLVKVAAGGVATFVVFAVITTRARPTLSALRSNRVQWEERQKEIFAAQQESNAASEAPAPSDRPQEMSHD